MRLYNTNATGFAHAWWYVRTLLLKRIDAWGVSFIVGAIALLIHNQVNFQTLLLLSVITLNYWFGFILNDYYDSNYDALDQAKGSDNLFVQVVAAKQLLKSAALLIVGYSLAVFGLLGGVKGIALLMLGYVVMWGYSSPPLRLKSRPVIDLLVHGLFVQSFPYWVCLFLIDAEWMLVDYILFTINFSFSLGGQLFQQIRDFEVDSLTDRNFTIVFGMRTTFVLSRVTYLTGGLLIIIAAFAGLLPAFVYPLVLLGLPLLLYRILHHGNGAYPMYPRTLIYTITTLAMGYMVALLI